MTPPTTPRRVFMTGSLLRRDQGRAREGRGFAARGRLWRRPAEGSTPARAWLYDQNHNRIDDRIEAVHAQGLAAAYENGDLTGRMMIGVAAGPPISYRVYVGYDHHPTNPDVQAVTTVGASVLYAFHS